MVQLTAVNLLYSTQTASINATTAAVLALRSAQLQLMAAQLKIATTCIRYALGWTDVVLFSTNVKYRQKFRIRVIEVDVKEEDKEVKGKRKSLLKSMGEAKALSKLDNQSF